MTKDLILAELERHQDLLLPHTAAHLSESNLDVGCGSGVASLVHAARLGLSPTLCDVVDIRHAQARALPFRLIDGRTLPFHEQSFGSSYLQYVLHHLPGVDAIVCLLTECARVSATVVIVEEVTGPKTDISRARAFDRETNAYLHPGVLMPVFRYFSPAGVNAQLSAAGASLVGHAVVSVGSRENGWLETHVFVGSAPGARTDPRR